MAYCLDANIFIESKNRLFPMDIVPGFWDALDRAGRKGTVFVIHDVFKEVTDGHDNLAEWMSERPFLKQDHRRCEKTQDRYGELSEAIEKRRPKYRPSAITQFHTEADPWVISFAAANDHTVVSHEGRMPKAVRKVSVPDVCDLLHVSCINTIDLLRALNVKLVLR